MDPAIGAILYAGVYWGMYEFRTVVGNCIFFCLSYMGLTIWLWSMYVYIGGALFSVTAPAGFFLFVTIPCALLPAVLVAIFGKRQRNQALEELAR